MTRFQYHARDVHGTTVTGIVAAQTMDEAGQALRAEGKYIVKLQPAPEQESLEDAAFALEIAAKKVKRKDVIYFAHQMAVMIETGVPISEAMESIVEQATDPNFRLVIGEVTEQVQSGVELSKAMAKYPRVFPSIMVSLVRASEVSGTMGTMLERISHYMSKEADSMRQAKGAMMYPAFMAIVAMGVTVFLLVFILPKFAEIYTQRQAVLPLPTRILLGLSDALITYWYAWIGGVVGLGICVFAATQFEMGRKFIDWLKLNTPLIGSVFSKLYLSRACRTMGTMLAAGVSVLDMVDITRQVTNNYFYHRLWDNVSEQLQRGAQLSDVFFESKLVPRSISQMVFSGEKSGRLGAVMDKVAGFPEAELDDTIKTTTQFIEPLLVGTMGIVIGFVAISLLLPIFSVGRVMSGG